MADRLLKEWSIEEGDGGENGGMATCCEVRVTPQNSDRNKIFG